MGHGEGFLNFTVKWNVCAERSNAKYFIYSLKCRGRGFCWERSTGVKSLYLLVTALGKGKGLADPSSINNLMRQYLLLNR